MDPFLASAFLESGEPPEPLQPKPIRKESHSCNYRWGKRLPPIARQATFS